ncbi:hypothetical protein P8452_09706 [Trifolium repens]|nr:hypothetical protein P8452_09706 [Trifolium repens]
MTVLHKIKNFHLRKSSSAGITHVNLLPTFQFVGADDQKENWRNVDITTLIDTSILESLLPDSDFRQATSICYNLHPQL